MFGTNMNRPAQTPDMALTQPPPDSISKIAFAPVISPLAGGTDILAVASWDNNVRLYAVRGDGQSEPRAMYSHDKPVLDLAWHSDGTKLFSGGCDGAVKVFDLSTGQATTIHTHDKPVKCVEFVNAGGQEILVTAGWDAQMRYWDLRNNTAILNPQTNQPVVLSERAYAMGHNNRMLVVATADRKIHVFKWDNPFVPYKTVESPLRWQTRVIRCFPQVDAFAIGSIEGRVGIHYPFDESTNPKDNQHYSFKCHRYDITPTSLPQPLASNSRASTTSNNGVVQTSQQVFAVNDICFHREYETFCTAGADGSITFWDGLGRTKLKGLTLKDLNNGDQDAKPLVPGSPVVSCSFNSNHSIFAYALSYDWSKGHVGVPTAQQTHLMPKVMLHPVKPEEVQKKKK